MRGRISLSILTLLAMAEANQKRQMEDMASKFREPQPPPMPETDAQREARMRHLGRGPQRKCKRGRR